MNELRREDLTRFFGEVVPASRGQQAQQMALQVQQILGLTAGQPPPTDDEAEDEDEGAG